MSPNFHINIVSGFRSEQQNKIIQGSIQTASLHSRLHSYYALNYKNNTADGKWFNNMIRKFCRNQENIQKRWDERCTRNRIKNSVLDCGCEKVKNKI